MELAGERVAFLDRVSFARLGLGFGVRGEDQRNYGNPFLILP